MAEQTVNQENNGTQGAAPESEKTFTQKDLDAAIKARLDREKSKYADYEELKKKAEAFDKQEEASKSELQKATEKAAKLQAELDAAKAAETIRTMREKVSKETGVPASLLTAGTEEECTEQAKAIMEFSGKDTYPDVRDGGETHHTGKKEPKDEFAEWANKQLK